ncbi:fimbrial protein [Mesorhizobium sp. L-8-10]|uniref:fimbria/pilus outer membrane usher protein n=1 Tax=Mesorhizobium sp. L-8-10 TaxID=2744523 RepID=UPI0019269FD8|nr:fimbria/pilus outer membrane usher protein [Mesorhizobium sp. L-8-10]BCH28967.1 fimbrial protein [Mesorhizobium sp. L-8-10]
MRRLVSGAASILLSTAMTVPALRGMDAIAEAFAATASGTEAAAPDGPRELQLEVFIDGEPTGWIAAFRRDADGRLSIEPYQLRNVGIEPIDAATRPDGRIDIGALPDVSYEYDEAGQAIRFIVGFDARSARIIEAQESDAETPQTKPQSSYGALANYTLYASTGGKEIDDLWAFNGVSGWLEGRLFSPFGVFSSSYVATSAPNEIYSSTRLDTTWSYSSRGLLTTISAGDVINGGLSWTRPVRLGGLQVRRNFGLRPDLVTIPLPELSGSAAVPSTVDVYVNNARRLSQDVPAGPFQITDLPIVTGSGTARVVVRDALGRETVSETPFFASAELLAPGLWDYSAEAGFARRLYGVESNDYDSSLMASGTARFGLDDWMTLEAHAEGGGGLVNGGAGAVFGLGRFGVGSFSATASSFEGGTGYQLGGSVELQLWTMRLYARVQRAFGDYTDIAAVTADLGEPATPEFDFTTVAPPRALDQVSLSVPLSFDPATLNFSFTRIETMEDDRARILSFLVNRPIGSSASLFATAFTDLDDGDSFGLFAGLSVQFGNGIDGSAGVSSDSEGTSVVTDLVRSGDASIGSLSWRLREGEGAHTNRAAAAAYRAPVARLAAGVEQYDGDYRVTGQVDGAVVLAGGDIFLSNRIDDAFTVVDTGAPGVDVELENRPAGRTNRNGKLLVTGLRSYERNQISIDPANLPVDAVVDGTRETTMPADRSGTVVKFGVDRNSDAALITLRDEAGEFVEAGAAGTIDGAGQEFVVGYDGQAFVAGLGPRNRVTIDQPTRGRCAAEFGFVRQPGKQVSIPDVVCRSIQ